MRVGISCFHSDKSAPVVELAREAEARGFDELWAPEHTHIPTGRETPWPMQQSDLPDFYRRSMDPWVALAAAAAVTKTIRLGTSVALVGQHDPIVLAKTISSVDLVSGGRVIVGVGFGWNVDEMRHHGVDPDKRRTIGREKVLAMKQLWTQEQAEYHGKYVNFSPSWQWPKPVQKPHPPVWVGGGKATLKHAVEWGDGWMPIQGVMPVAKMAIRVRDMLQEAGRDPKQFTVYLSGGPADPEQLEQYRAAGIDGITLGIDPYCDLDAAKRSLDEHAEFRDRYCN